MLFGDRLAAAVRETSVPLCVGLDPHLARLPAALRAGFAGRSGRAGRAAAAAAVADWGAAVVAACAAARVPAVKPQLAFYEQLGAAGMEALEDTVAAARAAGLLVVADAKRGDIASTAAAYAAALLDPDGPLGADALTLSPYMGLDTLEPYLPVCRAAGRGLFVLVRTTNPGSAAIQAAGAPALARRVAEGLEAIGADTIGESGFSAVGAVVGASAAAEAGALRAAMPHAWFLVPGVGEQGGGLAEGLAGARADGLGALVVQARSATFPSAANAEYDESWPSWLRTRISHLANDMRAHHSVSAAGGAGLR